MGEPAATGPGVALMPRAARLAATGARAARLLLSRRTFLAVHRAAVILEGGADD